MTQSEKEKIINFIRTLYNSENGIIPLHEPRFIGNEQQYVADCIKSTFVSSIGKYVNEFEDKIAAFVGSKFAIATVNGTAALHIALIVAGVQNNEEVITQPLTFVATANAIKYSGAHPVFIDIDRETLGISPDSLKDFLETETVQKSSGLYNKKTKRKISACVPMHTFGLPSQIDKIIEICKRYNVSVIEDAAESLGSKFKDKYTGTFGKAGILSFNGNKIITSGGGGMILTNDEKYATLCKHITTTAKIPHKWEFNHDMIGYNYRMPNINAALGLAQLEKIEYFLKSKRDIAEKYFSLFKDSEYEILHETPGSLSNYWLNAIILNDKNEKNDFLEFCHQNKILSRPVWNLIPKLPMYTYCQSTDLSNAEWFEERLVNLPSSAKI